MKTFGRYLTYRLKQSCLRTLIFTILSVLLTQAVILDELSQNYKQSGLYIVAVILGILCTIIPILETAEYKNRRNLDVLYSFSISRGKLAVLHFLSGWIQIIVSYTVTYLCACYTLLTHQTHFSLIYLLPYYFFSLGIGLITYSVFLFLFGEANTEGDGVLFCFLSIFALALVFLAIDTQIRIFTDRGKSLPFDSFWGCIYEPIDSLTVVFQYWIHASESASRGVIQIQKESYMFAFWALIGIAAAIGYFYTFTHKRAEKIGDISTSWFGYKMLIPTYYFSLLLSGFLGTEFILIFVLFILMLSGYFIYRRSFKLRKSDIIVLACAFLLGVGSSF